MFIALVFVIAQNWQSAKTSSIWLNKVGTMEYSLLERGANCRGTEPLEGDLRGACGVDKSALSA